MTDQPSPPLDYRAGPTAPVGGALLTVEHVTIQFGGLRAVNDFNFSLNPGELVGLIGPNGAGKTTAFNVVTGVYRPTSGQITLENKPIAGLPPLPSPLWPALPATGAAAPADPPVPAFDGATVSLLLEHPCAIATISAHVPRAEHPPKDNFMIAKLAPRFTSPQAKPRFTLSFPMRLNGKRGGCEDNPVG